MNRYEPFAQPTVVTNDTLSRVLGLLGVAALFTAAGALISPALGRGGFFVALFGGLACVFILPFVKERAPLNYILLYGFATLEGVILGSIVELYVASGLGLLVLNAAAATGVVTLVAGGVGYTTKRDLSGMGGFLFIGLIALLITSVVGIFIHLQFLQLIISAAGAVLFSAYLVFDLNRVARATNVTQGDAIVLAISVYLDVVNLFLYLLRLLGILSGRD